MRAKPRVTRNSLIRQINNAFDEEAARLQRTEIERGGGKQRDEEDAGCLYQSFLGSAVVLARKYYDIVDD